MTAKWDDLSSLFRHKSDLLINLHKPTNDSPFLWRTNQQMTEMWRWIDFWRIDGLLENGDIVIIVCTNASSLLNKLISPDIASICSMFILIRLYLCLKCHSKPFESLPPLTIHNSVWNHLCLMPYAHQFAVCTLVNSLFLISQSVIIIDK